MTTQKKCFYGVAAVLAVAIVTVFVGVAVPTVEIVEGPYGECLYEVDHGNGGTLHDCGWREYKRAW
jgi:hypothetical protein